MNFADDAPSNSQVLEVVGTGGGPRAVISPLAINFGDQPVGVASANQVVTLTNAGNQPLTISQAVLSGLDAAQFPTVSAGNACGVGTLAPNQSCEVIVNFTPVNSGLQTAEIDFVDNTGLLTGSEQIVPISGTGTGSGATPALAISPTALSFGTQPVGVTSGTQAVTLTNSGNAPLSLSSFTITGSNSTNFGFFVRGANPCPLPSGSLKPGAACTVLVDFMPQADGPVGAAFTITDNAAGSPQSVALSGTGGTSGIALSATSLNFGSQTVGAPSAQQPVAVTNTGTSPVAMTLLIAGSAPPDFTETDNCTQSPLPAGSKCTINVTFNPAETGNRSAILQISDSAPRSPQIVMLSGTAAQAAATVSPTGTINFNSELAGTSAPPVTVTLTNSGTGAAILSVSGASVNDTADFSFKNNCMAGVPAGAACTFAVTFDPAVAAASAPCGSTANTRNATLTITDNAPQSPQHIALSGNSMDYCLNPTGLNSQTVTAGGPATYQLSAGSFNGFSGAVSLTCTDPAAVSVCSVLPASINIAPGPQVPFQVSVTTTVNGEAPFGEEHNDRRVKELGISWREALLLLVILFSAWSAAVKPFPSRHFRRIQAGAMLVLLSSGLTACFASSGATTAATGTVAGTYTLTVTGTYTPAGSTTSTSRTVPLTLIVQ